MNIENDELFTYPYTEDIAILYSQSMDKWAIETLDDSYTVDDDSFKEDIFFDESTSISIKDFHKIQAVILQRIEYAKTI